MTQTLAAASPNFAFLSAYDPRLVRAAMLARLVGQLREHTSNLANQGCGEVQTINSLDQSILAKAFHGELVPQDPSDEPASVLLERIRVAREAEAAEKAAGKKRKGKAVRGKRGGS